MSSKKLLLFLPLLVFALLVVVFLSRIGKDNQYMPSALIGKALPDFSLVELHSDQLMSKQALGSGSYLINFWGTWCPACSYEHPYLMKLAQQGVVIIGIDYKDDSNAAVKWLQEKGNPYKHVLLDEMGEFGVNMGVTGAPETFIVNSVGIITYRYQGAIDEQVWQKMKEFL